MVRKAFASLKDRSRRGIAAVEFALTLPVWIVLILGISDGCYFLLVNEKADRISYSVTDIITQYKTITKSDLDDIMVGAGELMKPMSFTENGHIIVSSVLQSSTGPVIKWQYLSGAAQCTSKVGTSVGGPATLPNSMMALNANDNVIITEVCYQFTPLFLADATCDPYSITSAGLCFPSTVYRVAVYKPRLSALTNPPT